METLGPYAIRMLARQFNHITTSSLQKIAHTPLLKHCVQMKAMLKNDT